MDSKEGLRVFSFCFWFEKLFSLVFRCGKDFEALRTVVKMFGICPVMVIDILAIASEIAPFISLFFVIQVIGLVSTAGTGKLFCLSHIFVELVI